MTAAQFLSLFFGDLYFIRLHLCDYRQKSERITHSQMEAMRVFEGIDIVEALLAGFVRHMKPHTPVYTDDEHTHIIAYTHTRAHSHAHTHAYLRRQPGFRQLQVRYGTAH